jgi:hypothetical protein
MGAKSDQPPAAAEGESKGLRILRLGDLPGGIADLEELKDSIADSLQNQFGDHEDTGTLIDHAVKVLKRLQRLTLTLTPSTPPQPHSQPQPSRQPSPRPSPPTRCCRRAWR